MPKSILVLDDPASSLAELVQALGKAGYAPVLVDDGEDPSVRFDQLEPEMLFLSLGHAAAIPTCEAIREKPEGAIVPIIFVGNGSQAVKSPADALAQGGDFYFGLPVDLKKLLA